MTARIDQFGPPAPPPLSTMAVDQYGGTYHDLGPHPRTELLRRLGRRHADRMYRDTADGSTVHVGYIIAGLWLELYDVAPRRVAA